MGKDFLRFRRMVAPLVIEVLFWIGLVLVVIMGLAMMAGVGDAAMSRRESFLGGLMLVVLGPIGVRLYAELLIVVFRINETLTDVRNHLEERRLDPGLGG